MSQKTITTKCPDDVYAGLKALAKSMGLPLAAYMRLLHLQHVRTPLKLKVPGETKQTKGGV